MVNVYIRMCNDIEHEEESGTGLLPLCGRCKVLLRQISQEELDYIQNMKDSDSGKKQS